MIISLLVIAAVIIIFFWLRKPAPEIIPEPVVPTTIAKPVVPAGYEGWQVYRNNKLGYSVWYPGNCEVIGMDLNESVTFEGPKNKYGDLWPQIFISHYSTKFYRPGRGMTVAERVGSYPDYKGPAKIKVAGVPTVLVASGIKSDEFGSDQYFFIKDGQLYQIMFLHTDEAKKNSTLFTKFLKGFKFN
ncbi:MAG: hypothetical protein KKA31_01360 [Candidatus Margulisbacteria bacterium]|nr:hypothetical protein [Candidatus Margulisiibacteriota bacterium]